MAPEIINRSANPPAVVPTEADRPDRGNGLTPWQRAIVANPHDAIAHKQLGNDLVAAGDFGAAGRAYDRALALDPAFAEAAANRGHVALRQGDRATAIARYRQALAIAPTLPKLWRLLGNVLLDSGDATGAIAALEQAIATDGGDRLIRWLLGSARLQSGDFEGARSWFAAQVALDPDCPEPYTGLAQSYFYLEAFDQAIAIAQAGLRRTNQHSPNYARLWGSLATTYYEIGDLDRAIAAIETALRLDPDNADMHWARANVWLHQGNYRQGFEEFEWRWPAVLPRREFAQPPWAGEPLGGQTLLVYCQAGLGDILHLCRYLPTLAQRCQHLIVEAPRALVRTLATIPGVDRVLCQGDPLPPFDVQISMLSIPKLLTPDLASIPNAVPYLHAPAGDRAIGSITKQPGEMHIGIAWASGRQPGLDGRRDHRNRSCPVAELVAALQHPHGRLHSLQVGPDRKALQTLPPATRATIVDWGDRIRDFADTAAIVAQLDLVVCVDTSVAHLAGALGLDTWILLPQMPNWRWQQHRTDCPWYPTATLFRQTAFKDWSAPLQSVRAALNHRWSDRQGAPHVQA